MITRKQKPVLIKQYHVAARVTGDRNCDQVAIDFYRIITPDNSLDVPTLCAISAMHNSLALELLREPFMIGNIILVRQEHRAHAAHFFDLLDELGGEPR